MNYLTEIAVKTIQECAYSLGDEFLLNTPLCDVLNIKIGDIDCHPHYFEILKQLPSADVSEKLLNMTIAAYIFPEFDNKLFNIFGFRLNIRIVNAVYDIREDFDVCFILYEIFCKMSEIDSEQSPFLSVNMYLTNRLFMYLNGKDYAKEKNKEQYGIVLREFNFNIEDLKVSQKIKDTLSEIYNFRK
ncbi:MAG: hypothetical protein LBM93_11155, partial [Oscillospiraceae bacterium]|nr:hypothetical protein [Oscillospiraceae bacterium]